MATLAAGHETRIVFLTRDPVVHEHSGSTTYILGLLQLLRVHGAEVTIVSTTAFSRSPRLFFRSLAALPEGVHSRFPGYLRVGPFYFLLTKPKAWARALSRFAMRHRRLQPLLRACERLYGHGLYTGPWDLTPPTPAECEAAIREAGAAGATVVIANYCIWGPLLADGRLGNRRTAILMHDLLSVRAQRFEEAGTPLDMPRITEAEEFLWLSGASTVLAAQPREAAAVAPHVPGQVLVTPIMLRPRALDPDALIEGRCLFVGSNIPPNRLSLAFLLESVWPLVRAGVPGATLAVAGTVSHAIAAQQATGSGSLGIEALGVVPELEAEYARAAVCLVPLRLGTGIKIKLLEALGFAKAIVSTTVGIEGLEASVCDAVEVADDAQAFAAAILKLLTDPHLRRERELAALQLAQQHFGPNQHLDPHFVHALL